MLGHGTFKGNPLGRHTNITKTRWAVPRLCSTRFRHRKKTSILNVGMLYNFFRSSQMRKCKKSKFKVGLQKRDRLFSPMIFVGHKQFITDTIIYLKNFDLNDVYHRIY